MDFAIHTIPKNVQLEFGDDHNVQSEFTIKNTIDRHVIVKILTNRKERYSVIPPIGIIEPKRSIKICIQATEFLAYEEESSKDKFRISFTESNDDLILKELKDFLICDDLEGFKKSLRENDIKLNNHIDIKVDSSAITNIDYQPTQHQIQTSIDTRRLQNLLADSNEKNEMLIKENDQLKQIYINEKENNESKEKDIQNLIVQNKELIKENEQLRILQESLQIELTNLEKNRNQVEIPFEKQKDDVGSFETTLNEEIEEEEKEEELFTEVHDFDEKDDDDFESVSIESENENENENENMSNDSLKENIDKEFNQTKKLKDSFENEILFPKRHSFSNKPFDSSDKNFFTILALVFLLGILLGQFIN
eukprot:TRINITY_DN2552_c1_g2_i1.p1 TRINITY_DN2552_c1_g2~~TRINITY_DN2552_c1_g2_i1.p1  ORF type:complete len:375 (-),score=125.97 TRINITY_DN2552_c1_g2_i1:23-1117(-)